MNNRKFDVFNKDNKIIAKGLELNALVALIIGYSSSVVEKITFTIVEEDDAAEEVIAEV